MNVTIKIFWTEEAAQEFANRMQKSHSGKYDYSVEEKPDGSFGVQFKRKEGVQ